jgi:hypothetical protein
LCKFVTALHDRRRRKPNNRVLEVSFQDLQDSLEQQDGEMQVVSAVASVDFTAPQPLSTMKIREHSAGPCSEDVSAHFHQVCQEDKKSSMTTLLVLCVLPHSITEVDNILNDVLLGALSKPAVNEDDRQLLFSIVELLPNKCPQFASTLSTTAASSTGINDIFNGRRFFAPVTYMEDFCCISLFESVSEMRQRSHEYNMSTKASVSNAGQPKKATRRQKWRDKNIFLKLKWVPPKKEKRPRGDSLSQPTMKGMYVLPHVNLLMMVTCVPYVPACNVYLFY